MRSLRLLHWCCFLCLAATVLGQGPLEARVVDAASSEPLPYASIICAATGESVITNEDGVFRMIAVREEDSLVFSYLGYQRLRMVVAKVRARAEVRLFPATKELDAVRVTGRSDALYDMVVDCGKHMRKIGRYTGKTYYELETRTRDMPVEAIECFYNGSFNGADIEALDLKEGRIGLLPDNGRYVVNLNTSRGFMLLHPAESNSAFPATPLQYRSRKALRHNYDLTVLSVTHDPEELYHLRFTPKDTGGSFFHGELWIDAATGTVRSLQLDCDSCTRHPFLPMVPGDELRALALHCRQTYTTWEGRSILSTVELDYALTYHSTHHDPRSAALMEGFPLDRRIRSKGILHVFAPGEAFILPLFHYDAGQMDYRKVLSMPYDSIFWAEAPKLVRTDRQQRDQELFAKEGLLLGNNRSLDRDRPGKDQRGFFESNYAFWSPTVRISLKDMTDSSGYVPPTAKNSDAMATSSQMNLVAQLFLNIDEVPGGYRTFSATVFDGFSSYFHLTDRKNADVLLNLFFDLCEMERRHMQAALDEPGLTLERIRAIHAEAQRNMDRRTGRLLKETHYGTDPKRMAQWNTLVVSDLGINNFALFGISPAR